MSLPREEEPRLFQKLHGKEALALVGPRRVGKSTLALRLLAAWQEQGGEGRYLDLEAVGAPITAEALAREVETVPEKGLVVLDEVQAADWIRVVRQEVEQGRRRVLVTGSSASLLSGEVASALGGRAFPELVLPLSYRDARSWGLRSLQEYFRAGGYPECVLRPADAPALHKLYFELAILRDVAARQRVREVKPLSDLAVLLLSEPGKSVAAAKTARMLGISQPTFRSFVRGLNDAFLILSVPPYLRSPRQRLVADAKHYAYDTGLQGTVSLSASQDWGRRHENLVAVELVRRGYALSYLRNSSGECDFVAQRTGAPPLAVQVWSGEGQPPARELSGLLAGMKGAKAEGLLLTSEPFGGDLPRHVRAAGIEQWLQER